MSAGFLTDPGLAANGVRHGFGLRGSREPLGLVRPHQVHGSAVARVTAEGRADPAVADAIVSSQRVHAVAVVTADCVPILLAAAAGRAVAAVHAGWRGLAAGVVASGVEALREHAPGAGALRAALGPHIRPCCYEVDAPVLSGLRARFGAGLEAALEPARPGHHRLDLGALVRLELLGAGVDAGAIGTAAVACTRCDPLRFHSYRREGRAAGRLVHFIAPTGGGGEP